MYSFLVLVTLFASCQKEANTENNLVKYNSLTSLSSISDQKKAYSTLTASEKASMWSIHLDNMIKQNHYNPVQLEVIAEAKELLIANRDANNKDFVNSDAFIIWNHKAAEAFTNNEIFSLFVTLKRKSNINNVMDGGGTQSCGCSTVSDWCNVPKPPAGSDYYWQCDGGGGCTIITSDCGTFWRYDCNSTCKVHTIFSNL